MSDTDGQDLSDRPSPSALAPLRHRAFAILWVATVASNVGTWMNDVGAGWLMTELAPSPATVALVQAATTLPVFLFALPAGALADITDRRRLLIRVNLGMALTAAAMTRLVAAGAMTASLLLVFTFLLGAGAAFVAPAWQAVVPGLVPRADLPSAVSLNSVGINVSRAIGPAVAGALIVALGLWAPFLVNALSFLGILVALGLWRGERAGGDRVPPETLVPAMLAGLRYACNSRALQRTLVRAAAFFLFASCYWAMLPLIARDVLGGGAELYGLLLGAVGAGAVSGAAALPIARRHLGADGMVAAGSVATALTLVAFALAPGHAVAVGAAAVGGLAWIAVLSSLQVSTQTALPDWVRARGLSLFLMVFSGTMALGSLVWGQVATATGITTALLIAAAGAIVAVPLSWRAKLTTGAAPDLGPAMHWPEPVWTLPGEAGDRRMAVHVTYVVKRADQTAFLAMMHELAMARRRNGGYAWSLMQDAADPERFVEAWSESSWTQHLRHHARVTGAERLLQEQVRALLAPGTAPDIRHLVAPAPEAETEQPTTESDGRA
ncbi:MFS transporter [Limibaculum sp. M0105]|uniref:MFS transporter n=1 Tax=Thermohalobaculum xanthum TaxID=2753746 RepID=A0A8J7MAU1_9RHOB|nr:MFS transporter [Thermohalobaculum xanthum]MBK0400980.1 MFS transporter [Thermohalobaculum xanthum]